MKQEGQRSVDRQIRSFADLHQYNSGELTFHHPHRPKTTKPVAVDDTMNALLIRAAASVRRRDDKHS